MRLQHVKPGQRFILSRTGEDYTCHGRHPVRGHQVLIEPYQPGGAQLRSLSIACEVELIQDIRGALRCR